MISKGLYDIEEWSNDAENFIQIPIQMKTILKHFNMAILNGIHILQYSKTDLR